MKHFRLFKLSSLLFCALASVIFGASAHAQDKVNFNVTLIIGSNDGGGVDAQLKQYEQNLKKVLPFDTFKRQGSGRASVDVPGSSTINLGSDQKVTLSVQSAGGGRYRISAKWQRGNQTLQNTTVVASKNLPTVLVGGGRYILLLIAN